MEFRPWPGYAKSWCGQVCRLMFQQVPEELTQLRALAATVGGTIEGLEPEPQIQAERIQDYLSDPDRFLYSLTAVQMDTSCLLYTSPSPRDQRGSRMPSSS